MTRMVDWIGDTWHADGACWDYLIWREDAGYVLATKVGTKRRHREAKFSSLEEAQDLADLIEQREFERLSRWLPVSS